MNRSKTTLFSPWTNDKLAGASWECRRDPFLDTSSTGPTRVFALENLCKKCPPGSRENICLPCRLASGVLVFSEYDLFRPGTWRCWQMNDPFSPCCPCGKRGWVVLVGKKKMRTTYQHDCYTPWLTVSPPGIMKIPRGWDRWDETCFNDYSSLFYFLPTLYRLNPTQKHKTGPLWHW